MLYGKLTNNSISAIGGWARSTWYQVAGHDDIDLSALPSQSKVSRDGTAPGDGSRDAICCFRLRGPAILCTHSKSVHFE
jgi:hypothetical protein